MVRCPSPLSLLLLPPLFIAINAHQFVQYVYNPRPAQSLQQIEMQRIEHVVEKCYRGWCRDWMLECHWFCDAIRGLDNYGRCMECLRPRGSACFECFDL
uniref:ShKT domain-containing protein n=1 Tax=Globodera pallida TaxID=36090 RepID=A0A183CAJ0_GLOPA